MGIISEIGRRNIKTRLLIMSIYIILILGSLTMLYPFVLMISGTGRSNIDASEIKIIPVYLYDDDMLYRKTVDSFFNEDIIRAQHVYGISTNDFTRFPIPEKISSKLLDEWKIFIKNNNFPYYYYHLGFSRVGLSANSEPLNFRKFKDELFKKFDGDIVALNKSKETNYPLWQTITINELIFMHSNTIPNVSSLILNDWNEYKENSPISHRGYVTSNSFFKGALLYSRYSRNIAEYNNTHKTNYKSYNDILLTSRYPKDQNKFEQKDWEFFVRTLLNPIWIKIDSSANGVYNKFLKSKYKNIKSLNKQYDSNYSSFNEVKIPANISFENKAFSDYKSFIKGWENPETNVLYKAPITSLSIDSIDFKFQKYLKNKYLLIANLNHAMGSKYQNFDNILPPQHEYHYQEIMKNKNKFRWEFATRNFKTVFNYVMLQGRGLFNTTVYCFLSVLCAIIFNPIAAYALSRFQLPSTYKILLFLMLTMAFPQMVTQIPNFLLMREFNLLNTFFALILPGLANGYSIFLLKGFFDSLPKELYESAMLDGAGECRIFFQFTMALSTPILAVIALNAFTLSYSNFMMALLICQDPNMWTLMPWLYQLQMFSCQPVVYSSLLIASIPTFIIFMLCQNVIMRGIVVPVEK